MEQKKHNGTVRYEAPEVSLLEITVEAGFAESDMFFSAPDYDIDGIDF